jgi:ribosomal protein S27E
MTSGKFDDLTGRRFGRLLVIEVSERPEKSNNGTFWRCLCDCGNETIVLANSLKNGNTQSCGCYLKEVLKNKRKDLTGTRFNRLVVIGTSESPDGYKGRDTFWRCLCDCGNERIVCGSDLRRGHSGSCGCYTREKRSKGLGISSFNELLNRYRGGAKRRNLKFDITPEQFKVIINKDCYYCGKIPNQVSKNRFGHGDYIYNGIDRIDSSIGYTVENCVPCCGTCNVAKMAMSQQEFYSWIERVYNHSILKGRE